MLSPIWFLYYRLTAFIPRMLPRTDEEMRSLRVILHEVFGVPDEPESWATVTGYILSTPANRMTRSYWFLANVAKRLTVNKVADLTRKQHMHDLQIKLEKKIKQMNDEAEREEQNKEAEEKISRDIASADSSCADVRKSSEVHGGPAFEDCVETYSEGSDGDFRVPRKTN